MRILEQIVEVLNGRLQNGVLSSSYFQNGNWNTLAYLTNPTDDRPQKPYVVENGVTKDVIIDDRYSFNIYHRVLDAFFNPADTFGDGNGVVSMVCNMYAVIYADQQRTTYSPTDLALAVSAGLNYQLTPTDLGNSKILRVKASVVRANLNGSQVFSGEYGKGGHNPMQLTDVMIGIGYQLEITAHSSCLDCSTC